MLRTVYLFELEFITSYLDYSTKKKLESISYECRRGEETGRKH